jgi:hypothetical protein
VRQHRTHPRIHPKPGLAARTDDFEWLCWFLDHIHLLGRLLKKAQLLRWRARVLAAAYLEYAWTQLRWVPHPSLAALHLDLFEQPG